MTKCTLDQGAIPGRAGSRGTDRIYRPSGQSGQRPLIVVFSRRPVHNYSDFLFYTKNGITRFWGVMFPILGFIRNFSHNSRPAGGREGRRAPLAQPTHYRTHLLPYTTDIAIIVSLV